MSKKNNGSVFVEVLSFPFKVLKIDKVLTFWIISTLLAGFFTFFSDILSGKKTNETFNQGIIYVFSITLLISVISDSIIYLLSEYKKEEAEMNFGIISKKKLLPIIKKYSITSYIVVILFFSVNIIVASIILYSGNNKYNKMLQLIIGVVSLYISFYYFCLNRVSQYPLNYNEYIKIEKKT